MPGIMYHLAFAEEVHRHLKNNINNVQFFAKPSEGGILYNGYTQINKLLLSNNNIKPETLQILPDILPPTGIPVFDTRRKKTWREELNGYLAQDMPYTGEALDYSRLWSSIVTIAKKFVTEEI